MPELPDIVVYVEALRARIAGHRLDRLLLFSPFVLRSVEPPIEHVHGRLICDLRRVGKRIVFQFGRSTAPQRAQGAPPDVDDLFLVIHLMIAGRLRWRERGQKPGVRPKLVLAVFEFDNGTLLFTEASSKKRASIQLVQGEAALADHDPGGPRTARCLHRGFPRRSDS